MSERDNADGGAPKVRSITGRKAWCGVSAVVLAASLAVSPVVAPAEAQQGGDGVLARLQASAKLRAPHDILADYLNGAPETEVIVLLQPTSVATALAARSRASAQVPAEFAAPGAPTYYNLQDPAVRSQLRATVAEAVERAVAALGGAGVTVTRRFSYQFGFAARVTPAALERIVDLPGVIAVEKDAVLKAYLAQGIPLINAAAARSAYSGSGVSIAICDTGIDASHPMLGGGAFPNAKVIGGYDTGDGDADPTPGSTGEAHGTACAGIAAGDAGATVGDYIGGVAPGARLYAVKISTRRTGMATTSAMIAGWEWALTHQHDDPANPILIISTSFGGDRFTSSCDADTAAMTTAAANAVAAGITIFAAAGNEGYCDAIAWPACISYVNAVGAVYDAAFGTYKPCISELSCAPKTATAGCSTGWYATDVTSADMVASYSNTASFLSLFAPSNKAATTDIVGSGGYSSGAYYTSFGGTSAATPYAAGAAAVLQQAAKAKSGSYLTPAQVRAYLTDNGDAVTDGKVAVTRPRVNLGRAVDALPYTMLNVTSTNPTAGVVIAVSPSDVDALGDGPTPFARSYVGGTVVTLTAPATAGGNPFSSWIGCTSAAGTICSVTLSSARTVTAYYRDTSITAVVPNDFDGDGKSDIGCYFPPGGNWYGFNSADGFWQTVFGYTGTLPITGRFDGDSKIDIGCYFPDGGNWYLSKSAEGFWQTQFGFAGTIPVVGDFDGDGTSDIGAYHPESGGWYLYKSSEGFAQTQFGFAGTIPVVGDFDGDGRDDIGCYYPPGGNWYVFRSRDGFWQTQFGYAGTIPVVGDFDGDGRSDIGCYYPPGGNWYVFRSSLGFWQTVFGYAGTEPVVGDFDGDGKSDLGCYYPTGGNWYVFRTSQGFWETQFGYEGTIPLGGTLR